MNKYGIPERVSFGKPDQMQAVQDIDSDAKKAIAAIFTGHHVEGEEDNRDWTTLELRNLGVQLVITLERKERVYIDAGKIEEAAKVKKLAHELDVLFQTIANKNEAPKGFLEQVQEVLERNK